MRLARLADIPWDAWSSPAGKFQGSGRQVSIALGSRPDAPGGGSHPFDLEYGRLLPGKSGCPFHSHSSQWELFVIQAGSGTVRHGAQRRDVRVGDAILHPPGPEAHQLMNTGEVDLEYLLIADNPAVDIWHYPDSDKWGYRPAGGIFRKIPADYHLGEEEGAPLEVAPRPLPVPTAAQQARFVSIASIPEVERSSPKKVFCSHVRDISLALGGVRDVGTWGGGHPFDLQQRRVPPGAAVCPCHVHTVQWELFLVLAGTATVRADAATHQVTAGDVFIQPPGTAHQIRNHGTTDLVFHVIADNSPAEICYYPDSNKWMIDPQGKAFRMTEVDYFDGEE
jgi:uncharacterized cupin superfamily protein